MRTWLYELAYGLAFISLCAFFLFLYFTLQESDLIALKTSLIGWLPW